MLVHNFLDIVLCILVSEHVFVLNLYVLFMLFCMFVCLGFICTFVCFCLSSVYWFVFIVVFPNLHSSRKEMHRFLLDGIFQVGILVCTVPAGIRVTKTRGGHNTFLTN